MTRNALQPFQQETGAGRHVLPLSERQRAAIRNPDRHLNNIQSEWLKPRRWWLRFPYRCLFIINQLLLRLLFRVEIHGLENLPDKQQFILASNHSSPLDSPLLAYALPLNVLQRTYWAGKRSTVLKNWFRRLLSRITRVIPISNGSNALAVGAAVLRDSNLVWFPEGRRSLTGELQPFKPGIARLQSELQVAIVPVRIDGAWEAFSDRTAWPKLRARIAVRIGPVLHCEGEHLDVLNSIRTAIVSL